MALRNSSLIDIGLSLLSGIDVKKSPKGRTGELVALLTVSQTANQSLEAEKILNNTVDKVIELLDFDVGYIRTPDAEDKNLIVRVSRGLSSPEFLSSAFALDSPEPIVGKTVFETQKPYIGTDIRTDPTFKARTMEREGLVSVAMVPIVFRERTLGFLAVGSKHAHRFTNDQVRLATGFSAELGTALGNAQLFDTVRNQAAQLSEWNRTLEERVQEQLSQLEQLGRLKPFFPPKLVDLIVSGGSDNLLNPHRREITVVFLDLRGFTAFAETFEPEEVMNVLREYHTEMGKLVVQYEGTLERFTGDGMMIFFNDPVSISNPAEQAARMAVAMRASFAKLAVKWMDRGYELGFGVGISHGYATIGGIGFEGRLDYAAIGPVANLASRLCDAAKHSQILISQRVVGMLKDLIEVEPLGALNLKGFHHPVAAYNIRDLKA